MSTVEKIMMWMPGVGHVVDGWWHPGRRDGCPKCPAHGCCPPHSDCRDDCDGMCECC